MHDDPPFRAMLVDEREDSREHRFEHEGTLVIIRDMGDQVELAFPNKTCIVHVHDCRPGRANKATF